MARFTVLTLNWNGLEVLPAMVESLAGPVEELGGELVVFDNGSSDGSQDLVEKQWGDRSWFRLVRSGKNLGFAGGASRAIDDIDSEIIVLANSDTFFLPGSLEELLSAAEEGGPFGVMGPRLLWPDGTLQRSMRDFPFPGAYQGTSAGSQKGFGGERPAYRKKECGLACGSGDGISAGRFP